MTPNPSDLTPAQRQTINRFVAEKQGWHTRFVSTPDGEDGDVWVDPDGWSHEEPPDLFASLDACHKVFCKMSLVDQISHHYHLRNVVRTVCAENLGEESVVMVSVNATAPQRALALYLTMGGVL